MKGKTNNVVDTKPKGDKPDFNGVISSIPEEQGVYGEQIGTIALWHSKPKDDSKPNPFAPNYYGNVKFLGVQGRAVLWVNKDAVGHFPVLSGAVKNFGGSEIGKIALWNFEPKKESASEKPPKYNGTITIFDGTTKTKYRVALWG